MKSYSEKLLGNDRLTIKDLQLTIKNLQLNDDWNPVDFNYKLLDIIIEFISEQIAAYENWDEFNEYKVKHC